MDVIVFEPLYKIYGSGSDENSTGDMAELMNGANRLGDCLRRAF